MDGKLIGLVRDTLVRHYGPDLWDALADPPQKREEARPSDALACWLGRQAVPALRDRYPTLFSRHADLASFILGLGDELPVTGPRDADPSITVEFRSCRTPDGQILLRISADCSLCALIQGVIAGAAVHYGQTVTIEEIKSRRRGDNVCVLQLELGELVSAPDSGGRMAFGGF